MSAPGRRKREYRSAKHEGSPVNDPVRFLLNGHLVAASGLTPQTTLLEYLRERAHLTGTKEGCAEGDCGACTVAILERDADGAPAWRAVNACIRLLPTVDGKAVHTVESLRGDDGTPHPVQQALIACHASQCGFCTPGFAMSLFALYKNVHRPSRDAVHDALSGNLCRCTGYRPIADAAQAMYDLPAPDGWRGPGVDADGTRRASDAEAATIATLAALARTDTFEYTDGAQRFLAPVTLAALAQLVAANPGAQIVAGGTDVGLWVTKERRVLPDIIHVGQVRELAAIRATAGAAGPMLEIGAAATLADAFAALDAEWPELAEAWQRFASVPIRNSGTLGGNVANGSPIGDSMPALIALGAAVVLCGADGRGGCTSRELPLEAFYVAYRRTARAADEFVAAIRVPKRPAAAGRGPVVRAYKVSRRFDQDISAVFVGVRLDLDGERIVAARIGCGGVAATPSRAPVTEALLAGRLWNRATADAAAAALAAEFSPLTDMRATAGYRRAMLGALLLRCWHETAADAGPVRAVTRVGEVAA